MKIIPVLDVLNGQTVHAVGGLRSTYQPLQTKYCESSCPLELTRVLNGHFGFQDWYIADLDGIVHRRWNIPLLSRLEPTLGTYRIDAGIQQIEDCFELGPLLCQSRCIVSTESLADRSVFDAMVCMCDPASLVFSLDLVDSLLNSPDQAWGNYDALEIVGYVADRGVQELIVIDLAYVGRDRGPGTLELCSAIRREYPELTILTGGGVRTAEHLDTVEQSGVDAVLVGTALHHGLLTDDVIERYCSCLPDLESDSKTSG